MSNCEECESLIKLIEKGMAFNVTCWKCGRSLKHIKKIETITPTVPIFQSKYRKSTPKKIVEPKQHYQQMNEPRKQITQKHWDAMYQKYHESWGIDATIKWLNKKFQVID